MRAGNSFLHELFRIMPNIDIGQILLQRDEKDKQKKPIFYYCKLPQNLTNKTVLLFDPMLASGGSCIKAIEEIIKVGVKEENIIFINLIACEEGLRNLYERFPHL